jgi:N-acetylglucosamine-6-phosphate deacetylase
LSGESLVLYNAVVYTPRSVIQDGAVLVRDGKICKVGPRHEVLHSGVETIDVEGRLVCPGFVDLQVNGGGGAFLTEDASYESVCMIAKTHSSFGTTSLLPTVITSPEDQIRAALSAVSDAARRGTGTATVLGAHLEGPFISEKQKGTHDERHILRSSIQEFSTFYEASQGTLRLLTLAPELPGSLPLIEYAVAKGVAVSIGHSAATFSEVKTAVDAGATMVTHIFNGMTDLDSREPGTVGAALSIDGLRTGLIADGIHVHPMSMKVCIRAKGVEKVFLVTDAMPPVGTSMTSFRIHDKEISVREGRLYDPSGTLSGSTLTMNRAVRVINEAVGIPLHEAIAMATINPAVALGIDGQKGTLEPGRDADIVICDRDLTISKVLVKGRVIHESKD